MDAPNAPSAPATAVAVDDDGLETATATQTTMKAIVHSRYGAPDVLELNDIDKPTVNDDAVLVAVTEKRTPEDIDRLADVLGQVAR